MLKRCSRFATVILASMFSLIMALPAHASTSMISRSSNDVRATLTYQGTLNQAHDLTLAITRAGIVELHASVSSSMCGHLCWPTPIGPVLQVVNFGGPSPDVVLRLYSGGAHCCFVDQVFAASAGHYVKSQLVLGDPTASIERLVPSRPLVFVTADDSFAYAFTDFAASGLPVKVLAFRGHHFVDVTNNYRSVVARDARRWWRAFVATAKSHYADSVGLAAAWAADEDRLGRFALVAHVLANEARAGHLLSALSPHSGESWHFIAHLDRFLIQRGYRR